jgi:hypothetical protein
LRKYAANGIPEDVPVVLGGGGVGQYMRGPDVDVLAFLDRS